MGHPWSGRYDQGAALHDYLYRHLGWVVLPGNGVGLLKPHYPICSMVPLGNGAVAVQFTRQAIDRMFYEAIQLLGTSEAKAYTMYIGVRSGGWKPWRNYEIGWHGSPSLVHLDSLPRPKKNTSKTSWVKASPGDNL